MPVITIQNSKLTAQITTYGAELISLQDRGGKEYLWQGDPAVWQSHAPILFPIVSRLTDGKYQLDGVTYEMTNHGFAKYSEFTVEEQSKSRAVLKITDNESKGLAEHFLSKRILVYLRCIGLNLFICFSASNECEASAKTHCKTKNE